MVAEFLTNDQREQYGHFPAEIDDALLHQYFHLDEADLAFINKRRRSSNKLGVSLQLTSVRFLGRFVSDPDLVPDHVVEYLAQQLGITDFSAIANPISPFECLGALFLYARRSSKSRTVEATQPRK